MNEITNKTIREIAVEMPAAIPVFEKLKIDYCCGGDKYFAEACELANIAEDTLISKIAMVANESQGGNSLDGFSKKACDELVDYIVNKHHVFAKSEIERLTPLMEKVYRRHGEHHPNLRKLRELFARLTDDLIPHMKKEEYVLFPYIKELVITEQMKRALPAPHFGTVANPIKMMMMEHDTAGDILAEMRKTTDDYTTPENACPSFIGLYFGLEKLEKDLHKHIHLENNLLFPKAQELEQSIQAAE